MDRKWIWFFIALAALLAAGTGAIVLASWKSSKGAKKYLPMLNAVEVKYGIPTDLLARIAYQESRFREDIIKGDVSSQAGAEGLMQIVPKYHPGVNPLDPVAAADYAGSFLRSLYNTFGSWRKAAAAYNAGQGNLTKDLADGIFGDDLPTETKNYVTQIFNDLPGTYA